MLDQTTSDVAPSLKLSGSSPIKRRKANQELTPKIRQPSRRPLSKTAQSKNLPVPKTPLTDAVSISSDEGGRATLDTQPKHPSLVASIRGAHRQRQDFHRAEKSLTLQIKAIERRLSQASSAALPASHVPGEPIEESDGDLSMGDLLEQAATVGFFAAEPLVLARAVIKPCRMRSERECQRLAKRLPVWPWVEAINGFGALGLAQIIGETGDLSLYSNPAKVWKRMGLAVFNGKSQRRVAGAGAIEQGYSPVRRSIMFCIGDSLLKKQNPYRELYLARKVLEQSKLPDGTKMHWHRRAQRYVEKRLLRDLWRAWRDLVTIDPQQGNVSPCAATHEVPS